MKEKMNVKLLFQSTILCNKIALIWLFVGFLPAFAQNTCATAVPVTAGLTTVSAIDGTNIITTCSTASLAEWFAYTPSENYSLTITSDLAINICKDTRFNVYTGNCNALTCYSGDDDSGTIVCNVGNQNSYLSKKTFDVYAGNTYYIAWDNRWSAIGFDFQIIEAPMALNPCSTALPVTAGITTVPGIDGSNVTTVCSNTTLANWYTYTPTQNFQVTISSDLLANICKDTNFSVYTGSCSGVLTCATTDDNSGIIECNLGNTFSNLSKKSFTANAGTTYYIVWDNKWSAAGFDFEITQAPIVIVPPPISYTVQSVSTINSSYNTCIVDMNGDSIDDIVGVSTGNLRIHYQGALGAFTVSNFPVSGTSFMPTWSIAAGDLNKDGFNDLLLGAGNGLTFWESNNTGTGYTSLTPGQYIFCQRTNFVDINNDGNLDAFSCHDIDPNVYYLNDGFGNYTYFQSGVTPGAYSLGIIPSGGNYASLWTDMDNDGDQDMFISKCSGPPCELHRNDGNGVFTDISAIAQIDFVAVDSWSSAIADYDNDGDMDIIVGSNGSVRTKFYKNNLDTTNTVEEAYTDITIGSGWETNISTKRDYIAYDFDNDGLVDVLGGGNKIMFNNGDNTFRAVSYAGIDVGAIGDLNNDGFLDFLNGSSIRYAVPNGNNWIKIALKGIQSNSNGIGARVEIYGPWGKQIRDIRSGEGFGYMSTLNAMFGIGTATTISQLVIKWPSGLTDTYFNIEPNQLFSVIEGTSLAINTFDSSLIRVYPNPAKNILTVTSTESIVMKSAHIFDLNGKSILKSDLLNNTIAIENLKTGTYIIVLRDSKGKEYSQKFLKE